MYLYKISCRVEVGINLFNIKCTRVPTLFVTYYKRIKIYNCYNVQTNFIFLSINKELKCLALLCNVQHLYMNEHSFVARQKLSILDNASHDISNLKSQYIP